MKRFIEGDYCPCYVSFMPADAINAEDANTIHGAWRPQHLSAKSCDYLFHGNSVR